MNDSLPTAPARIEITQFLGGKRIAVTTSFDDGVVEDRHVVESLNEWGLKGTFNLNSGKLGRTGQRLPIQPNQWATIDASEVATLYAGHEVAIHTVTHPFLERLDASQIATEVLDDRKALEDMVGYAVRGMAYPFGTRNSQVIEVLRALGIVYCRAVDGGGYAFPPPEPLTWAPTAHQFEASPQPLVQRWEAFYGNPKSTGLFYVWGHAYEFNRPGHDWSELPRVYQPLAGKSDVWYCSNIELFDYEAARKRMIIAANRRTAMNPSAIPVTLNVDGQLVEVPPGKTIALSAKK
jgi:peptidoglycan/xylan/chitin deacetylase (PgdA/CDA1 family)